MNDVTDYVNVAKLIQKKIKIDWQPFASAGFSLLSEPMTPAEANAILNELRPHYGSLIKNSFSIIDSGEKSEMSCIIQVDLPSVDITQLNKNASDAYTRGATKEILKTLPPELGSHVGSFLDRETGHIVGRAHPRAHNSGLKEVEVEQEKRERSLKHRK